MSAGAECVLHGIFNIAFVLGLEGSDGSGGGAGTGRDTSGTPLVAAEVAGIIQG